jgi:poly(U)-specific endoribonuclease
VFTWNGDIKKFGSMFVGTSPELVMALDTICFLARTDGVCPMSLNNVPIYITTYTMHQGGETFIGTAYPDWEKPY